MNPKNTVVVTPMNNYPALLMKWGAEADASDIKKAYRSISEALEVASSPLYVVVDLRENSKMPIKDTVTGAIFGPYTHRKLAAWLVIGGHQVAQIVASTLNQMSRQHKVEWFDSEEELYSRLQILAEEKKQTEQT